MAILNRNFNKTKLWRKTMTNLLNEKAIKEAAYFIWKNAGCPANTSLQDWNAAIQQLTAASNNSKKSSSKTSSCKTVSLKKTSSKSKAKKAK